jgi:hypothetical protein
MARNFVEPLSCGESLPLLTTVCSRLHAKGFSDTFLFSCLLLRFWYMPHGKLSGQSDIRPNWHRFLRNKSVQRSGFDATVSRS